MSSSIKSALTMLRLSVNNHPGVMSHICGLFAGRAYNLEGILVTPEDDGATCRMWLVVKAGLLLGAVRPGRTNCPVRGCAA